MNKNEATIYQMTWNELQQLVLANNMKSVMKIIDDSVERQIKEGREVY